MHLRWAAATLSWVLLNLRSPSFIERMTESDCLGTGAPNGAPKRLSASHTNSPHVTCIICLWPPRLVIGARLVIGRPSGTEAAGAYQSIRV